MKALFIGGTGIISSAVSELAVKKGIELFHFNRGKSHRQINGVNHIRGDIRNIEETEKILNGYQFDVVVNWINFIPEHVKADIEIFSGKTKQYIFISSASAYQKPVQKLPINEDTPLYNPYWEYAQLKAQCENLLLDACKKKDFPVTIVRPSHTYDYSMVTTGWGYTILDRMLKGKKVIIHGDGTSIWVLTHNTDFARGFVGLMGKQEAIGEAYHITSDELLTWNRIFQMHADALGVPLNAVHVPTDFIARYAPDRGASLLGDKSHSVIFDNAKIKKLVPDFQCTVPFSQGVQEVVSWYRNNKKWQIADENINSIVDTIISIYENRWVKV
ncbi:MAG: NAD-dependent epimerase/dehydratase family protein [Bacteroidetes bacterium]|jgi:nucleoside-diphosphate-sugar epimerase|nr:NAD-dependent epimerase/dehydratase family protein [Bacteroidota bacterium]